MATFYAASKRKGKGKPQPKLPSVGRDVFFNKAKKHVPPGGYSTEACQGIRNVLSAGKPSARQHAYTECVEVLNKTGDKSLPTLSTITKSKTLLKLDPTVPKSGLTKSGEPVLVLEDWYDLIEIAAAPDPVTGKLKNVEAVAKVFRNSENSQGKRFAVVGKYVEDYAFPNPNDYEAEQEAIAASTNISSTANSSVAMSPASSTTAHSTTTVTINPNNGSSGESAPEQEVENASHSAFQQNRMTAGDGAISNTNAVKSEASSVSEAATASAGVSLAPPIIRSTPRDAAVVTAEAASTLMGFASTSGAQAPTPRANGATANNTGATTNAAEAASTLLGFASTSGVASGTQGVPGQGSTLPVNGATPTINGITTNAVEAASTLLGCASASGDMSGAEGHLASRAGATATASAETDVAKVLAGLAGMTLGSATPSDYAAPGIAPANQGPVGQTPAPLSVVHPGGISTIGQTPAPPPVVHPGGIPGVVNATSASLGEDDELTFTGEQSTRPPSPVDSHYHHQGDVRGYYGFPNLDGSVAGGGSVTTGGTSGNYPQYIMDYYDQLDDAAEDRDVEYATVAERNAAAAVAGQAAAVATHSEIAQQVAAMAAENTRSRRERRAQRFQAMQA